MPNPRLPYERDPIPQDKEPPSFEPETIGSKIVFGFSIALGCFFVTLVLMGIWRSFNQFFNYLSGLL
ncbi:MAG: hypothetical protein HOG63_04345 [Nitrospina sp.]|jgi:hypothetical protein|nr:hypothetical protein [Nitrospina sp.]MBT4104320.1 hypothetical protein [Nitrospina sp.]MBT4390985.1 hypothetical protein [Nitrospina sp.]MBT5957785.1 hypothetical protein [Nitrospina sp.]MBT6409174.1 hypothetical protein [Nitrospina sp.]